MGDLVMDTLVKVPNELELLIAAYKLRLVEAAEKVGGVASWGKGHLINRAEEENKLAGAQEYRISPYPYPGLRSFEPREGDLFFGRDRSVRQVRERLERQRVVVVLGGSGSGKSSLLRAGLLPYLNTKHRISGRGGSWYSTEFRPRTQPLEELADALAEQLILPQVDLKVPGLPEALGLQPGVFGDAACRSLKEILRRQFRQAAERGSRALLDLLLDVANRRLDDIDRLASRGLRAPDPSLLLLLDQFEEVFRPEVPSKERDVLLNLIVDFYNYVNGESDKGGLFLAITMRSEELHRCAEHRGLSEVVNRSLYLLELMDPNDKSDAQDLHRAIVQPARDVFEDWGLDYDHDNVDAPFEKGFPGWLLEGAKAVSRQLEHRPDQLPLLQHALQATWHSAVRRWSGQRDAKPTLDVRRSDLPGQTISGNGPPDLSACLRYRADKATVEAIGRFDAVAGTDRNGLSTGGPALQAAFRALARRDDRGNWARRFAAKRDIVAFLDADTTPDLASLTSRLRWKAAKRALRIFVMRGYLSGGDGRPYDISHEALIRNWPQFQEWLRDPIEVAYALNRVMQEVDPTEFTAMTSAKKIEAIPSELAHKVTLVTAAGGLPREWGEEQIVPALLRPSMSRRWGETAAVALRKIGQLCAVADRARRWKQVRSATTMTVIAFGLVSIAYLLNELLSKSSGLRAMGANNLISSMQSDSWPTGMPERAAVHALEMLTRSDAGKTPETAKVRRTTAGNWDTAVRMILGRRYVVSKLNSGSPEGGQAAQADDLICRGGAQDSEEYAVLPQPAGLAPLPKAIRIALLAEQGQRRVAFQSYDGNKWRDVSDNFDRLYPSGTRVCLAPDARVLTVSWPGPRLPAFREMAWQRCSDTNQCDWRVITTTDYVQPFGGEMDLPTNGAFPCIRSIASGEHAARYGGLQIPFLKVVFTSDDSSSACGRPSAAPSFEAAFLPGIATVHPSTSAVEFSECSQSGETRGQPRSPTMCSTKAYFVPNVTTKVNVRIDPTDDGQWLLSLEPGPEMHVSAVQRLPLGVEVKRVGFDSFGDLILADSSNAMWKLITNLERLRAALNQRALYGRDKKYVPQLQELMTLEEIRKDQP
jgi:hypothetical protein